MPDGPDWYEAEPSLTEVLVAELRRLKRRARARLPLVLLLGSLVTALIVYKSATKQTRYRARVVLAITEGDLAAGRQATPLDALREYFTTVLLSNDKLMPIIERRELFPLRKKLGDSYALGELRDMFDVAVWRNYFQYEYSYDERRTARVAIVFTHTDPVFAREMVQELTTLIITGEGERRAEAARLLAAQSAEVLASARRNLDAANAELTRVTMAAAEADHAGNPTAAAVLRLRATEQQVEATRAQEAFMAVEQATTMEALQAQVTAAGLALTIEVVDQRNPREPEGSKLVSLLIVGVLGFLVAVPLTGIVIGVFDTRVHDTDDVARLDLPVLGHVPGFPGDGVGALRTRGIPRLRMKGFRRWR